MKNTCKFVISIMAGTPPNLTHYSDEDKVWKRFPHYWPFKGESTGDRWIPLTKDQWCGASMSPLYLTQTMNSLIAADIQ